MHILDLELQAGTCVSCAVYGNFSGAKQHELVLARSGGIELFRPDNTGRMVSVNYSSCFAVIRCLHSFRLLGSNFDYLVIGSDSGKLSIMEYDSNKNMWHTLHLETFGKSGCRRAIPGQYVASDPKGRAVFVGAVEESRFVYVMNRDSSNHLTISSPLEAHHPATILFSCVGLDVGLDNPVFAMLELEYTDADADPSGAAVSTAEKKLTYYELDLGLNHVVRRWSEPAARTAHFLLPVPGSPEGPGGTLICGENWLSYKHQGVDEVRAPLPRRKGFPASRGLLAIAGVAHRQRGSFFFLVQSELGDLYKVTLDVEEGKVVGLVIRVFDSIPPAVTLCITRTGLLFAGCEHGNHYLFQFLSLGDNEDAVSSRAVDDIELDDGPLAAASVAPTFQPSSKLSNLSICDEMESLSPVTDIIVAADGSKYQNSEKKVHVLTGNAHRSRIRSLQHGSSVSELAAAPLPHKAGNLWTIRSSIKDEFDSHIVVSFASSTLVLAVGDTIEETADSGFLLDTSTLAVTLLRDNSRVQIHPSGIRHVRSDGQSIVEWRAPEGRKVEAACANSCQLVLSMEGEGGGDGEILVFELDDVGQLAEVGSCKLTTPAISLDIAPVEKGRTRAPFLAVGLLNDTVQVLTLEPTDSSGILSQKSLLAVGSRPDSLRFVRMSQIERSGNHSLNLYVGLQTGVLYSVVVDAHSGALSDSRQRFLGTKPPKLIRQNMHSSGAGEGLLSISNRSWLSYSLRDRFYHLPLSYDVMDSACTFSSDACPEGLVVTVGSSLRVVAIEGVGMTFHQTSMPLPYTPRKVARTNDGLLVVVTSDQHCFNSSERAEQTDIADFLLRTAESESLKQEDEVECDETQIMPLLGPIPETHGKWASCICVVDPNSGQRVEVELQGNEAAFSVCVCPFSASSQQGLSYVVVGIAVGMTLQPRSAKGYLLRVYQLGPDMQLSPLHDTAMADMPLCLSDFGGRLLAGIGKTLCIFDLGMKQLLNKCKSADFPSAVARLDYHGDRVFVADMAESVFFVKYKRLENAFVVFADDCVPRWMNNICALDHHTVAGSDKFGNVFVLRVDEATDDENDPSDGARSLWDVHGRAKVVQECHYYLGDMVSGLKKVQFVAGGVEFLLAVTISGEVHALLPLSSKGDVDFFVALEAHMREHYEPLCGRVHISYRSYYQPARHVVDATLCEQLGQLSPESQLAFAESVDRSTLEVRRKLSEQREMLF